MTIQSKYDVGDKIWILYDGEPFETQVRGVYYGSRYRGWTEEARLYYAIVGFSAGYWFREEWIFSTKEDLIKSLYNIK